MEINRRFSAFTLTKPHILKRFGLWEVIPPAFIDTMKGSQNWYRQAQAYAQRMNCREMFIHNNSENQNDQIN